MAVVLVFWEEERKRDVTDMDGKVTIGESA
jgi:hypothetical protein